jgi:alpha-tubulin suppressor-like RCC1 family protein
VARLSIFLITVALIAGMVGCFQPSPFYKLTIASTAGGSVTTPREGTFTYVKGEIINLVAEAEEDYRFVEWTGDVGTIADVYAATTTITVSYNCYITAKFIKHYDLTIASTAGGSVTTPGEGTFAYDEGTVVNLVAKAEGGYQFVNWTGDVGTIADVNDATTTIIIDDHNSITANFTQITPMVAAGFEHTVGLKSNGTVVAVGDNYYGQCNVGSWTDITQVTAGAYHTMGLKSNGTVVTVGDNYYGQCNVGGWTDITQVTTCRYHTVGLKDDGTVVAVGWNDYGQCDIGNWTDITQVAAGGFHTVGLKSDGTVVVVGNNYYGQWNVGGWTDIIQVTTCHYHTVGLKDDGTVVAVGDNYYGQCDVGGWTDITQVVTGVYHTVGLKDDGTVVAVGWNDYGQCNVGGWTDITRVAAGGFHTVGLKSDGTVVAVGAETELPTWNLLEAAP